MIYRLVLAAAFAAAVSVSSAAAAPEPSFDCASAKENAEKAICADGELAALDLSITETFKAAVTRLDLAGGTILRADQRAWIAGRNAAFGRGEYNLKMEMEQRQAMLRETYVTAHRFLGQWVNASGSVLIKDRRGLIVSFEPSECDIGGVPRESGEAIVLASAKDGQDADNWSARITRRGALLKVDLVAPKRGQKPKPTCENGRSIEGFYFPAGR